jgi:hypothetical protein
MVRFQDPVGPRRVGDGHAPEHDAQPFANRLQRGRTGIILHVLDGKNRHQRSA